MQQKPALKPFYMPQQLAVVEALTSQSFPAGTKIDIFSGAMDMERAGIHSIEVNFHINDGLNQTFKLIIGYWDDHTNTNPETIALVHVRATTSDELMQLAKVGHVTDLLRQYGIWEQPKA